MPQGYPWSTPGVDFSSQGVISRRFKQKKSCDGRTNAQTNGRTDRHDGRNSDLDVGAHVRFRICTDVYFRVLTL